MDGAFLVSHLNGVPDVESESFQPFRYFSDVAFKERYTTMKPEKAKPVLEKLPGWKCDIRGIRNYEELSENCRRYIEFIEERIGYPITMVSNGPGRRDIIYRESPLKRV